MDKVRRIRLQNTLLAAAGGVLLSSEWLFAYWTNNILITEYWLSFLFIAFWLVNGAFILCVASGFSERMHDPSLSYAQMIWASSCCIGSLIIIPRYSELVYIPLLVIAVFGVFRLNPLRFKIYTLFVSAGMGTALFIQYKIALLDKSWIEFIAVWCVFSGCMFMLFSLCQSVSTLRLRLKKKNEDLSAAVATKSKFLANMSHELRTPMNGVLGMIELIEREELTSNQKKYLHIAKSSGQSLVALINDILDFSRIGSGKLVLEHAEFNLRQAIENVSHSFYFLAEKKGLDFIIDISPSLPKKVIGDQLRVTQVLNNILGNAIKFTDKGSVVLVVNVDSISSEQCQINIDVNDTGVGIAADKQETIFESFAQEDNSTTRKFGGSGLGLAISKSLCEQMQGNISVNSKPGEGSCFHIHLTVKTSLPSPVTDSKMEGARIIIVDDNDDRSQAVCRLLEYNKATVQTIKDTSDSVFSEDMRFKNIVSEIMSFKPSLVLVHKKYSNDTGLTLAKQLQERFIGKPTMIVMLQSIGDVLTDFEHVLKEPLSHDDMLTDLLHFQSQLVDVDKHQAVAAHESKLVPVASKERKVLLVEDNLVNQEVASMILEDCLLSVDIANNGAEAILRIKVAEPAYDMIFMDCQMPVMDGYETTRQIRSGIAGELAKTTPIIAMTANALTGDREKCMAVGMNDYISKPITFDSVQSKVTLWVSERE